MCGELYFTSGICWEKLKLYEVNVEFALRILRMSHIALLGVVKTSGNKGQMQKKPYYVGQIHWNLTSRTGPFPFENLFGQKLV